MIQQAMRKFYVLDIPSEYSEGEVPKYVEIDFTSIRAGQVFKAQEPDGTPLRFNGRERFIAASDAGRDAITVMRG